MTKFVSFLAPHLNAYREFCCASERWSAHTESVLRIFDRYCHESHAGSDSLTQGIINEWCKQRTSESGNSCRARIYPVYTFVKYLQERNLISEDLFPEIPKQNRCTYIPHFFTTEELKRFFFECDHLPVNRRSDYNRKLTVPVIFRLLYSTGMRTCEARQLKCDDVDLKHGVISIEKSKSGAQHYIVMHDSMTKLMERYDKSISKLYPNRVYFFPGARAPFRGEGWLCHTFREIWDKANTSNAIAYDLRHFYATYNINRWVGQGFDFFNKLVYLSQTMGHATLESTKYYYSLVPALSKILEAKTSSEDDLIIPEVDYEESNK